MSIKLPKIFLDSGDPEETKRAKGILGFIDGQTTNPSLVAKHPKARKLIESGKKLTENELLSFYQEIVVEIEREISGPISVEVYSDWETKAEEMLKQAEKMFEWGRNIQIKFPTTQEGIKAAQNFIKNGGKVNMTLVFNLEQAAAVYSLALNTDKPTFVSPFLGRWDDRAYHGLDLLKNIIKMYKTFSKQINKYPNVRVLASSIRTLDHFYGSIFLGADMLTVPLKIIQEWIQNERWVPDTNYRIETHGLKSIPYHDLVFSSNPEDYKIEKVSGDLLDEGLLKFSADWKSLIDN